jgi:hypothetical protein
MSTRNKRTVVGQISKHTLSELFYAAFLSFIQYRSKSLLACFLLHGTTEDKEFSRAVEPTEVWSPCSSSWVGLVSERESRVLLTWLTPDRNLIGECYVSNQRLAWEWVASNGTCSIVRSTQPLENLLTFVADRAKRNMNWIVHYLSRQWTVKMGRCDCCGGHDTVTWRMVPLRRCWTRICSNNSICL